MTETNYEKRIPVEFGGVSLNKEKARIGFSVDRCDSALDLEEADELFACVQLEVQLESDPNAAGDADGQQTMDAASVILEGVADVMRFGVASEKISASLVFNINALDVQALTRFRNSKGYVSVNRIGKAESKSDGQEM